MTFMLEFLRYAIVFFTVGWGGGLILGLLSIITLPLLSILRKTVLGRIMNAATTGLSTLIAVVLAYFFCQRTGGNATYGMFAIAFWAMVSNDLWRIRHAHNRSSILGQEVDEDPNTRAGLESTERMGLVGDLIGFSIGLTLLPTLSAF
jgi:phosphotransferase system  glucose/maltose/N-acetylglucosamine-specific IIC component